MTKLRVHNLSVTLDGFAAGVDQTLDAPFGRMDGEALHTWMFATAGARRLTGGEGGTTGLDDEMFAAGIDGIGATIMGRNMFGPIRGEWPDDDWSGWWGPEPPYHHPVFVLTHHARDPIPMEGGTTFHFVTDGIEAALAQATAAAGGRDVRLGGGASVVRQYVRAGLVDHLHLAIVPLVAGAGERVLDDADGTAATIAEGYDVTSFGPGEGDVTHVVLTRR
jgi:dihydrofolate reductase